MKMPLGELVLLVFGALCAGFAITYYIIFHLFPGVFP
jgi:hypothetical protein